MINLGRNKATANKGLTFTLILPLTIISFGTITKWWYALPVDAPDTLYSGFPFPFVGDGWNTSMSLQIFILEFLVDLSVYFLFWFMLVFCIHRFVTSIRPHKIFTTGLWTIAGLIIFWATFIASFPENRFYLRRSYDMEIIETGYKFVWKQTDRPGTL